ncbi:MULTISPECIES: phosphate ABC transporter permease PstA [Xanthobacter]|uniref:Phosphate transport system permease protein PstA n=1 Tax=Xanthobacter autotrophicus (strain ATCC BAA-1158 / Py2) TaxID=78245 RepID=A7IMD5_XANP2|nr:phosphate ABC transporter permease PstA [Xanthobacter oligotrophicus]ABS69178.1 phosphate ABC transporter, inner membrane subunit PstA [Xanthobacter autotrophicus Py2]MBP2147460.1 phosphate transport system permease protein [Xanthobacter flavus]MCG5237189.1 phosphate ABC transporter permease PstA [Xanthobacter oligotrophicus]
MKPLAAQPSRRLSDAEIVARAHRSDRNFAILGLSVLVISMIVLLSLIVDFMVDGLGRIDLDFLTSFPSRRASEAGILSAWVGTTLVMLVTTALAVPLGVAAGLYLEEYAPRNWITHLIEINVTNLAGVPSIIYGLLALGLFVQSFAMGQTILVAGITLALLILPIIIVATREAVRSIPLEIREGAYALGADKWQTVSGYILPTARPGILTGAIVGMSRAIGETAPIITIGALTFIAFLPPSPVQDTFPFINFNWLNSPFTVMPIQMFNWVSRPQAAFHVNAAATGLILLLMTLLMNAIAIWLRYKIRRSMR